MVDIRDQLSRTHGAINASTQLLVSQYGAISCQAQESNHVFLGKFQETANLVQRLAEICSTQQQESYKHHQETIKTIEHLARQARRNYGPGHASVALVHRLADKPALLKEISNAIEPFEQAQGHMVGLDLPTGPLRNRNRLAASVKNPKSQSILGRICICPRQRSVRERKWIQLGDSSFFGDWETKTHWDACPLSKVGSRKRRVAVGFNYTGLAHVLNTAIKMCFVLTYGAGGFSISPSFACTPTIDFMLDPAFRILDLIRYGFIYSRSCPERLMLACMRRLARLFDDRKACAIAVNEWNQSLMHYAILAVSLLHIIAILVKLISS